MAYLDKCLPNTFCRFTHGNDPAAETHRRYTNPLGECIGLCHQPLCGSRCGSNAQARRQSRTDDYLHLPLQPRVCIADSYLLSTDRASFGHHLLECFPSDTQQGLPRLGRSHAARLTHQEPATAKEVPPMAHTHPRPILLPMGLFADDCYRYHPEEHHECPDEPWLLGCYRSIGLGIMSVTIRGRLEDRSPSWLYH